MTGYPSQPVVACAEKGGAFGCGEASNTKSNTCGYNIPAGWALVIKDERSESAEPLEAFNIPVPRRTVRPKVASARAWS